MRMTPFFVAVAAIVAAPQVMSADDAATELANFKKCAKIEDNTARLACFDKAASGFDFAKAEQELTAARELKAEAERLREEKEALKQAEAQLETQRVEQFGQDHAVVRTVDEIETEILKIRKTRAATYVMLTNQQVWKFQSKKGMGVLEPGLKVAIKKGFMGNYRLTIIKNGKTIGVERIM